MKRNFTKLLKILLLIICCSSYSESSNALTYCVPTFLNGCDGFNPWHNNTIVVNTINWAIGTTSCSIYDYTSMSTTLTAGTPYPMTVTSGFFTGCTVWVDLNNNGSFEDPGECLFYEYLAPASGFATYSFNLTIPQCTPAGSYRMRVLAGWGTDGYTVGSGNGYGSCGAVIPYQYGNFDDFTLNVVAIGCTPPTLITPSVVTTTSADFSWTGAPCATYEYVLNTSTGTPTVTGSSTIATSLDTTGLTPGTTYYFHLRSLCSNGDTSAWVDTFFTTLPDCGVPVTPSVSGITTTTAIFNWGIPTGPFTVGDYQYTLNTTGISPTGPGTATSATSYTATGLTPGTTYYFYVRTLCASGDSSAWELVSFTTPQPCDPPTPPATSGITTTSGIISWTTASGAPITNYQYWLTNSPVTPTAPGTPTSALSYTASPLTPGTTYYFYIRTMCADGDSSAWVSISFTTLEPCNAPTDVAASSILDNGATLTWNIPSPGATLSGYQYVLDGTATVPSGPGTATTGTSYIATGLTPLTTYYFHVRTMCADGDSSAWVTITFNTQAVCGTPVIITNDLDYQGIHIMWTAVPNAYQYQYVLDQIPTPPTYPGTATTDTEYNMIGLVELTTYYFHLSAVCYAGESPWQTISFYTPKNTSGVSNVNNTEGLTINISPNPAKEIITVSIDGKPSGTAYVQLLDMAGRMLQTTLVTGKTVSVNVAELPQGMYLVQYIDDVNKQTAKLVKLK